MVLSEVKDPVTLEVLACREGLAPAMDLYIQNVQVASDCLNVINDIAARVGAKYEAATKEITTLRSFLYLGNFVHEKRDSNYEAHDLARFASSLDEGRHTWLGQPYDPICTPLIICFFFAMVFP